MKNKLFIGLTIAACPLTSAFFIQPTTAESSKVAKTNFATCKVKKNNADFLVEAMEKTIKLKKESRTIQWT